MESVIGLRADKIDKKATSAIKVLFNKKAAGFTAKDKVIHNAYLKDFFALAGNVDIDEEAVKDVRKESML